MVVRVMGYWTFTSSWYNETEVESVLYYINKLLQNEPHKVKQSDIGVIAAYKRQV